MAGITKQEDFSQVTLREVDFVSRFAKNWDALATILGIMRPIKKEAGTKLVSYETRMKDGALQGGIAVPEGGKIPFTEFEVVPKSYGDVAVEKYAKATSIESVAKYGAAIAVQKTDDQFLVELQNNVLTRFYNFLSTGTLRATESTWQMALATAKALTLNKFAMMRKDVTDVVGFANLNDAYKYLGAANITVQTMFGLNYIKDFMGYGTLFLLSDLDIPRGRVIAIPVENIDLYYIDPSDSEFAKLGLEYRTDGETNLIGFHAQGNYGNAIGEAYALMGMTLWAEYLDGFGIVDVTNGGVLDPVTLAGETNPVFEVDPATFQSNVSVANDTIKATLTKLTGSNAITDVWGEGYFLAYKVSGIDSDATACLIGVEPSAGAGLVNILPDPDKNGIVKITDPTVQTFVIITLDAAGNYSKQRFKFDITYAGGEG